MSPASPPRPKAENDIWPGWMASHEGERGREEGGSRAADELMLILQMIALSAKPYICTYMEQQ